MTVAYCWRNGVLEFGGSVPKDALFVDKGMGKEWIESIEAKCRLAYDGHTYLIPGIPEAESNDAALKALQRFMEWLELCRNKQAREKLIKQL